MILGFLVCPVATGAGAAIPPPQVSFIPHVTPVLITPTPPFSGLGPLEGGAVSVVGGFLWVGYASFPIGCEFQGGALIPTGSTTESATGLFGYSTIEGAPEYRLIWYTTPGTWTSPGPGEQHYLIIRADDPLFAGTPNVDDGDGFEDILGRVRDAERGFFMGTGGAIVGAGTAGLIQLLACPETLGLTCITAILTALGGGALAGVTAAWNVYDWISEAANLGAQFQTIALECALPADPLP